jgi:hypothetical protein
MLEERAVEDGMGALGRPGCAVGLLRGALRFRAFGTGALRIPDARHSYGQQHFGNRSCLCQRWEPHNQHIRSGSAGQRNMPELGRMYALSQLHGDTWRRSRPTRPPKPPKLRS